MDWTSVHAATAARDLAGHPCAVSDCGGGAGLSVTLPTSPHWGMTLCSPAERRQQYSTSQPGYTQDGPNLDLLYPLKPTVSPAKNSLVYFISICSIDHPVWRSHHEEAKRG